MFGFFTLCSSETAIISTNRKSKGPYFAVTADLYPKPAFRKMSLVKNKANSDNVSESLATATFG